MGVLFRNLDESDKKYINDDLRAYFDEVTYDTRHNWIMTYNECDFSKISTFDNEEHYLNEGEFESKKLYLFMYGYDLYKIHPNCRMELWNKKRYNINAIIDNLENAYETNYTTVQRRLYQASTNRQLVPLSSDNFDGEKYDITLYQTTFSNFEWVFNSDTLNSIQKIAIQFTGVKANIISQIQDVKNAINSCIDGEVDINIGINLEEDLEDTHIDVFIQFDKFANPSDSPMLIKELP